MKKIWTRQESKERFPKPITPLGWSLLQVPLRSSLEQMSKSLGVKIYRPEEMILWHEYYVYTRKDFFSDFRNLKFNFSHILKVATAATKAGWQTVYHYKEPGKFKNKFLNRLFLSLFGKEIQKMVDGWKSEIEKLKSMMGRNFSLDEITSIDYESFHKIRIQMQEDSKKFFAEDFNVYFMKNILWSLLKSHLKDTLSDEEKINSLLAELTLGLEGNYSIHMINDFSNEKLSVDDLKIKYGHLTDNWDLYAPTMSEVESIWLNRLQKKPFQYRKVAAADEIKKHLSWNPKVEILIKWLEELIIMDEDLRAYSSLQYPQARKLMKMVEQTPAFKEVILHENSVYFLSLEEIETGLKRNDFHPFFDAMRERRASFEKALTINPPFTFEMDEVGTIIHTPIANDTAQVLRGEIVSGGIATGRVIRINDYSDLSKVTKENIIVLESATPVYAPFYTIAGGIISERGGQLSHGAIVAREYGIPMLTGVENACLILYNDQLITLDADQGTIQVKSDERK